MNQPNEPRFSFEREFSEEDLTPNRGLKIKNKKTQQKNEAKQRFEAAVDEFQEKHAAQIQEALKFGQQYMGLLEDKTLLENKGPIQRSLEKEVINGLQEWSDRINNDPDEKVPNCRGTASVIAMVLPALFKLRDRINELEYQNQQMSKKIGEQSAEIKQLHTDLTTQSSGQPVKQ